MELPYLAQRRASVGFAANGTAERILLCSQPSLPKLTPILQASRLALKYFGRRIAVSSSVDSGGIYASENSEIASVKRSALLSIGQQSTTDKLRAPGRIPLGRFFLESSSCSKGDCATETTRR